MQRNRMTGAMIVAVLFSLLGFDTAAQDRGDCANELRTPKYVLTGECDFRETVASQIEPFWSTVVTRGVIKRDDLDLHYAHARSEISNRAIVISSGRTEGLAKYKELMYDLHSNGYSVYIIDHRGQGHSSRMLEDPHKGYVADFQDYVTDFKAFVDAEVRPQEFSELFLLAHSMGGAIATLYLEQHPGVFDAAALSSPMHEPDASIFGSPTLGCLWFRLTYLACDTCYVGFLDRGYAPAEFNDNILTNSPLRYEHMLTTYAEEEGAGRSVVLGGPTRRWVREACLASKQMIRDAGKIDIPVLVLQAGDDEAVTARGQDAFCEVLQSTANPGCVGGAPLKAGLVQAKHELFIEADEYRNQALTRILDFFDQHSR
ncbi:MAG: alpha/beta fold hydrolase [Pseudomonadota bacterium]